MSADAAAAAMAEAITCERGLGRVLARACALRWEMANGKRDGPREVRESCCRGCPHGEARVAAVPPGAIVPLRRGSGSRVPPHPTEERLTTAASAGATARVCPTCGAPSPPRAGTRGCVPKYCGTRCRRRAKYVKRVASRGKELVRAWSAAAVPAPHIENEEQREAALGKCEGEGCGQQFEKLYPAHRLCADCRKRARDGLGAEPAPAPMLAPKLVSEVLAESSDAQPSRAIIAQMVGAPYGVRVGGVEVLCADAAAVIELVRKLSQ